MMGNEQDRAGQIQALSDKGRFDGSGNIRGEKAMKLAIRQAQNQGVIVEIFVAKARP